MSSSIVFSRDGVILNACCLLNIYASGHMDTILKTLPIPIMIASYVYEQEPLRIPCEVKGGEGLADEQIDLQPFLTAGLLVMVSPTSEAELTSMINLAAVLPEDGEAITAALALHRRWAIGVDGLATISLLRRHIPDVQLISTPVLIKQWVERSRPPSHVIRTVLQNVQRSTGYAPSTHHPLYLWWQEVSGTEKN